MSQQVDVRHGEPVFPQVRWEVSLDQ
jgi:hypothetical protein